jgi:hypothetical protein
MVARVHFRVEPGDRKSKMQSRESCERKVGLHAKSREELEQQTTGGKVRKEEGRYYRRNILRL